MYLKLNIFSIENFIYIDFYKDQYIQGEIQGEFCFNFIRFFIFFENLNYVEYY